MRHIIKNPENLDICKSLDKYKESSTSLQAIHTFADQPFGTFCLEVRLHNKFYNPGHGHDYPFTSVDEYAFMKNDLIWLFVHQKIKKHNIKWYGDVSELTKWLEEDELFFRDVKFNIYNLYFTEQQYWQMYKMFYKIFFFMIHKYVSLGFNYISILVMREVSCVFGF